MRSAVLLLLLCLICAWQSRESSAHSTLSFSLTRDHSHRSLSRRTPLRRKYEEFLAIRGGSSSSTHEADVSTHRNKLSRTDKSSIEIIGSPTFIAHLDGVYQKTDWGMNGYPHYERTLDGENFNEEHSKIHLYWTGSQWVLHYDLEPSRNMRNLLAYAKVKEGEPLRTTSYWFVKEGEGYTAAPELEISRPRSPEERAHYKEQRQKKEQQLASTSGVSSKKTGKSVATEEFMGVPKELFPYYLAFMLDGIAVGIAMPILPFYVMELGANAFQLSLVVSANYVAQSFGCIMMGRVSDAYGRRIVLLMCLAASCASYFCVSSVNTLVGVALARVISGSFGGLIPVMQSAVADISSQADRPKYLGRISATFGLGFVLGPALSAILPTSMSARTKIRAASLFPLLGLASALLLAKETKKETRKLFASSSSSTSAAAMKALKVGAAAKVLSKEGSTTSQEVLLLVLNGYLLMYAFATETIYAMFIKDSFGFGEQKLSALFACNGILVGIFQVFLIKPLIGLIGKHGTLAIGNTVLAAGMAGFGLVRHKALHFALFGAHIVGYSIADTALVSLISRYSSPKFQGRDLALNQAAQSVARVISPILAGMLYEYSKVRGKLPVGALPFLVAALCPALGVAVPSLLYIRNVSRKRVLREKEKKTQHEHEPEQLQPRSE